MRSRKRVVVDQVSARDGASPANQREDTIAAAVRDSLAATGSASIGRSVQDRLRTAGITVSERQAYRYVKLYREGGRQALKDARGLPRPRAFVSVNPHLYEIVEAELARQLGKSTGTRSRAMERIRWEAQRADVPVPSRSTLYRLLAELDERHGAFSTATTRERTANRPNRSFHPVAVSRPGELVEIDSTPLDVLAILPDGSVGRPELTYGIDVATATICGALLLPRATRSADVAGVLLSRMVLAPERRPNWHDEVRALARALPSSPTAASEYEAAAMSAPTIVPETITLDRGRVFTSRTFARACDRLQISNVIASPYTPTDKPHVEGGFKRIRDGFVQYLDGYTGGAVENRGGSIARDAVWTVDEIQVLLNAWIAIVWQQTPRSGLRIPGLHGRPLSPNEMFDVLSGTAPQVEIDWDDDTYIELMPQTWRKVHSYGVNHGGLIYDAEALHTLRGRSSSLTGEARGRWEVRWDPVDVTRIWVRDHIAKRWLEATWALGRLVETPISSVDLRRAQRIVTAERPRVTLNLLQAIDAAQGQRPRRESQARTKVPSESPQVTSGIPAEERLTVVEASEASQRSSLPTFRLLE